MLADRLLLCRVGYGELILWAGATLIHSMGNYLTVYSVDQQTLGLEPGQL